MLLLGVGAGGFSEVVTSNQHKHLSRRVSENPASDDQQQGSAAKKRALTIDLD
jgi:hypothetical protein